MAMGTDSATADEFGSAAKAFAIAAELLQNIVESTAVQATRPSSALKSLVNQFSASNREIKRIVRSNAQ